MITECGKISWLSSPLALRRSFGCWLGAQYGSVLSWCGVSPDGLGRTWFHSRSGICRRPDTGAFLTQGIESVRLQVVRMTVSSFGHVLSAPPSQLGTGRP